MGDLDPVQPNDVRMLYYQSPGRFHVYLRSTITLLRRVRNEPLSSSLVRYIVSPLDSNVFAASYATVSVDPFLASL